MKTIKKIMFFANGNTASFDENEEQMPEYSYSWSNLFRNYLETKGIKIEGIEFEFPNGIKQMMKNNIWYEKALKHIEIVKLPEGLQIKTLNCAFFIASKLEAFLSRGDQKDLVISDIERNHDLEDVIILIDGRKGILDDIKSAPRDVKEFIKNEFKNLAQHSQIQDFVFNCLGEPQLEQRAQHVMKLFRSF